MRIWAPTFLTASNPNALRVITSIASKSLVIRSYSNLTSPSDRNFQGRLGRDLHPQAVEHARRTKQKGGHFWPPFFELLPVKRFRHPSRSRPASPWGL